jgi:hypothetical protein
MTKALDLVVKYQKIPFEDTKDSWPKLGHTSLLTPCNVIRTSTFMVHSRFFNVFTFLIHIMAIIHVE